MLYPNLLIRTIFLPHSRVPSQCFTSYSTSLNPPTPNVGIINVIRIYELFFSFSPFYEFFSVDHFLFYSRRPHSVSPHIQHLLTLLHPMWGLLMSFVSMSSPSLPLPSMSTFYVTHFLSHGGCPQTVSPHIQQGLTLLHPMWGLFMSLASMSSPSRPLPSMSSFLKTSFHTQHSLTFLHPVWELFMPSASMALLFSLSFP
jgi:hypothetical protein